MMLLYLLSGEVKLGIAALFFLGFGLSEISIQELSIWTWKQAQGTILECTTEWREQEKGRFVAPISAHVRYRYVVDGQAHESIRLTTGEPVSFFDIRQSAEFRKQHAPGAAVTVWYAPYAPSQASLFVERSAGPWVMLGFGLVLLAGAAYARWARKRDGGKPHPDVEIPIHAFMH